METCHTDVAPSHVEVLLLLLLPQPELEVQLPVTEIQTGLSKNRHLLKGYLRSSRAPGRNGASTENSAASVCCLRLSQADSYYRCCL